MPRVPMLKRNGINMEDCPPAVSISDAAIERNYRARAWKNFLSQTPADLGFAWHNAFPSVGTPIEYK